ncbi:uncharacterized protein ARMOST_11318 [Armillaria ostoyae]|uniref:Uncharacterized protein n=1 Tax=Armillaria ostoyae TaxID=47428 RepID=A0A284RGT7_ARMOS|nr:uncharacterized protein ARMOST_11318 [Armillaria ostoyae]
MAQAIRLDNGMGITFPCYRISTVSGSRSSQTPLPQTQRILYSVDLVSLTPTVMCPPFPLLVHPVDRLLSSVMSLAQMLGTASSSDNMAYMRLWQLRHELEELLAICVCTDIVMIHIEEPPLRSSPICSFDSFTDRCTPTGWPAIGVGTSLHL